MLELYGSDGSLRMFVPKVLNALERGVTDLGLFNRIARLEMDTFWLLSDRPGFYAMLLKIRTFNSCGGYELRLVANHSGWDGEKLMHVRAMSDAPPIVMDLFKKLVYKPNCVEIPFQGGDNKVRLRSKGDLQRVLSKHQIQDLDGQLVGRADCLVDFVSLLLLCDQLLQRRQIPPNTDDDKAFMLSLVTLLSRRVVTRQFDRL